jgi:hypothetical protein
MCRREWRASRGLQSDHRVFVRLRRKSKTLTQRTQRNTEKDGKNLSGAAQIERLSYWAKLRARLRGEKKTCADGMG